MIQISKGFFDADVSEVKPFDDEEDIIKRKPIGGGGTSVHNVFKYIADNMQNDPPISIIMLADGCAPFPDETVAKGIPVLWLLNNEEINPPWGKVARIKM